MVLPLAALIASLVRWVVQGSGNAYTAVHKRFLIHDPDLGGLRESAQHPIWLGLEVCAIIAAITVGLAIGAWVIRRREHKRGRPATLLRIASWLVALVPLAVPVIAFTSGGRPAGALDTRPAVTSTVTPSGSATEGLTGAVSAPAGRYEVLAHAGTSISAQLSAGGEKFDAVFKDDITGKLEADPRDLTRPLTAEISVAAASVDTGIGERSKHAREGYLDAARFPRITFKLDQIGFARQDGPDQVAFRANGTVGLIGKTHAVAITGSLRQPDRAALARLALTGDILLVQADFSIVIKETALAPDAGDFDGDRIPIHVSLVLRHTSH
ncbi:MAG: YceI family protein [Deltaproteobacteria bacterium]|nr:YceI family protein [Deltaproteobacteria bacterium]